jgi:hypothetical protein
MSRRVIYSRGFPSGAPLVMLRGGGLKVSGVLGYLRECGFRWNGARYAWEHYMYKDEFRDILLVLRTAYGCEVIPKSDLDPNYIIDLEI